MTEAPVVWQRTFVSELSANDIVVAILSDGRLEITFDSSDGEASEVEASWGERLDQGSTTEIARALTAVLDPGRRPDPWPIIEWLRENNPQALELCPYKVVGHG